MMTGYHRLVVPLALPRICYLRKFSTNSRGDPRDWGHVANTRDRFQRLNGEICRPGLSRLVGPPSEVDWVFIDNDRYTKSVM